MPDTNHNNQVDDSDEAKSITDEESTVNDAYLKNKIDEKEISEIETLEKLSEEAEQIKMVSGLGSAAGVTEIKPEEIKVEIPKEEKVEEEEQPQAAAPTPAEATQEISKEAKVEAAKEVASENNEPVKEFKTGI